MSDAVTREELDKMRCQAPDCTVDHGALFFHARCHPDVPTWTRYENGEVTVACSACEQVIVVVAVASSHG